MDYTSIKFGELAPATIVNESIIAHELAGFLKRATALELADFVSNYIGTSDSVAFYPLTITSGQQLPIPTASPVFSFVGIGTFLNVNGGPTIVTTEELNVLVYDNNVWILSVEIPITVDPIEIGITQSITSDVFDLAPSSDAVYDALLLKQDVLTFTPEDIANKQNTAVIDGTGTKYPTLDLVNNLATAILDNLMTSGIPQNTETFFLSDFSNTTLQIGPVNAAFFYNEPITSKIKSFPQLNYSLSNISMPINSKKNLYVAYDALGNIATNQAGFTDDNNYIELGSIIVKSDGAGNVTFLDQVPSTRNITTRPDVAGYNHLLRKISGITSTISPLPNANMTMKHNGGNVVGMSVNWGGVDHDQRNVVAANPFSFSRINPGTFNSPTVNPSVTILVVSDYWNGTAVVPLTGVNNASVQRVLVSTEGGLVVQMGEFQYASFQDAKDGVSTAPFTALLPTEDYKELCRIVAVKNATNLSNIDQAQFVVSGGTSSSGSGGGGVAVVNLGYTASPTQGTVTNDSGTSSTIPAGGTVNASLMLPADKLKLDGLGYFYKTAAFTAEKSKHYVVYGATPFTITSPAGVRGDAYFVTIIQGSALITIAGIPYTADLIQVSYNTSWYSNSLRNLYGGNASGPFSLLQPRTDTQSNWSAVNPILRSYELAFNQDTGQYKIGDNITPWNGLPYYGGSGVTIETSQVTVLASNWVAYAETYINTITVVGLDGLDAVDVIYTDNPALIAGVNFYPDIQSGISVFEIRADVPCTNNFNVQIRVIKGIIY